MNRLFYVLCVVISSIGHIVDGLAILNEDFELERQLNVINKSPIKSIYTKSGSIVDCVEINKQPAFDHPLLWNHTLQRKPSFKTSVKISAGKSSFPLEKVECPKETVPIQRTTKDSLIQSKSLFNAHILDQNKFRSFGAYAYHSDAIHYGVSGTTNVYNPKVSNGQSSESSLYVSNGIGDGTNVIAVGWHVYPQLYKDDKTHLFSLWTSDNFKSGCFNAYCGFVQTDRSYFLGSSIENTSSYGNPHVVQFSTSIYQDEKTQNWWLSVENKAIGYFPAHLFSNLNKATEVGWGGLVQSHPGVSASDPPMGSGHLPDGHVLHSAYFSHIQFINDRREDVGPVYGAVRTSSKAPEKCYGVKYYGYKGKELGCILLFGGPGGACGN
ncbi:protein neprosin-like [Vicia villosa]|uniref:protein neprosin-like n=1 Tax=Vicia villosa TaxID=3911 RepID=UPI00273AE1E1|nr:protein neprosin-like [Vicia villosa]